MIQTEQTYATSCRGMSKKLNGKWYLQIADLPMILEYILT